VTGASGLGNAYSGVVLSAVGAPTITNVTIGGTTGGSPNVISGNVDYGVELTGVEVQSNFVQGNYVGTNAAGTAALPNGQHGIYIPAAATGNTVGGSAAARNVISGNGQQGVRIDYLGTTGNVVSANFIGTDAAGTAGIPNGSSGVSITLDAANNTIGGVAAGAGNVIAYNVGGDGISTGAAAGAGNAILGNAIHGNSGLGIDLRNDGVTANDTGDGDTGPNNLQNFPVLSAAATDGVGSVHFAGSLNSAASTVYRVEFFASSAPDPTGFGEGQRYLGFTSVTTNTSGNAVIGASLGAGLIAGELVTATRPTRQQHVRVQRGRRGRRVPRGDHDREHGGRQCGLGVEPDRRPRGRRPHLVARSDHGHEQHGRRGHDPVRDPADGCEPSLLPERPDARSPDQHPGDDAR
jgi:hypothetical protein